MFSEKKGLVVVYKDEVLLNFVRKLVETNDDKEDAIVGTKDGTVDIIAWTEKVFEDNKKVGKTQNKVLFLGKFKGTNNLIPVLDIHFDRYGVKYGWAGRQAVVYVEPAALKNKDEYNKFLAEFNELPVPQNYKKEIVESTPKKVVSDVTAPAKQFDPMGTIASIALAAIAPLTAAISLGASLMADVFDNKKLLEQQMLLFGIMNFYNNDLEKFIKS